MALFEKIQLSWHGSPYVIPADKVMGAICVIEDVITFEELRRYAVRGTAPLGKLAKAYGTVLRYAGAQVADDDVYAEMFGRGSASRGSGGGSDPAAVQAVITAATMGLLQLMHPPAWSRLAEQKDTPPGNAPGPAAATSAAPSSRKPTRPRSAAAG